MKFARLSEGELLALVAQETHFVIGFAVVLGTALFFPGNVVALVAAIAGLLVLDLGKETLWDPRNEPGQPPFLYDGLTDWTFYVVGIAAGLGALLLAHHLVGAAL